MTTTSAVYEGMRDALVIFDRELRYTYVNAHAGRLFGRAPDSLVGRRYLDEYPEARGSVFHLCYLRALATRTEQRLEDSYGPWGRRFENRVIPYDDGLVVLFTELVEGGERSSREAAERALRKSEERYELAARATHNAIWDWDLVEGTLTWSEGIESTFGYTLGAYPNEVGYWESRIHPDDRERVMNSVAEAIGGARPGDDWFESYRFARADDHFVWVTGRGHVARDEHGVAVRMVGAMEDVSERRALEERYRQAQKMEVVGQLAGGIAHDFNNLLMVILGNIECARDDLPAEIAADHQVRADLEDAWHAAERARALVRQLLLFSRKQAQHHELIDLRQVVTDAERLLRRVIGEEILVSVSNGEGPLVVRSDAGQIEQLLLNLALNARDAMLTPMHGSNGAGGTLEIEVETVSIETTEPSEWGDLTPGEWARLRVRDTGHGMDDATRAHLFEPFFTTKSVGAGTGLGLATVFGIVRQSNGAIRIDSAPRAGTTVQVYLPRVHTEAVTPTEAATGRESGPSRTVLLVEDEAAVRAVARKFLERAGFVVLEARHGEDALSLWTTESSRIDLVITDLRMPVMGGQALVTRLRHERPTLPVVYASGYAREQEGIVLGPHERFLEKPYAVGALFAAVQSLLQGRH